MQLTRHHDRLAAGKPPRPSRFSTWHWDELRSDNGSGWRVSQAVSCCRSAANPFAALSAWHPVLERIRPCAGTFNVMTTIPCAGVGIDSLSDLCACFSYPQCSVDRCRRSRPEGLVRIGLAPWAAILAPCALISPDFHIDHDWSVNPDKILGNLKTSLAPLSELFTTKTTITAPCARGDKDDCTCYQRQKRKDEASQQK